MKRLITFLFGRTLYFVPDVVRHPKKFHTLPGVRKWEIIDGSISVIRFSGWFWSRHFVWTPNSLATSKRPE